MKTGFPLWTRKQALWKQIFLLKYGNGLSYENWLSYVEVETGFPIETGFLMQKRKHASYVKVETAFLCRNGNSLPN